MACSGVRVDTQDFNTGPTQSVAEVVQSNDGAKVFFVWSECKTLGATHNRVIQFRAYTPATATFGSIVQIDDVSSGTVNDVDQYAISLVQLDDGRLIVSWGLFMVSARESTDEGLNWTARASIDPGGTRALCGMSTDGTSVFAITQERSGGANSNDLFLWKRSGVGTWVAGPSAGGKIHNAGGTSTPPFFQPSSATRQMITIDANIGLYVNDYARVGGLGDVDTIRCLYTIDGWATISEITLVEYPDVFRRTPKMRLGGDGRIRILWCDDQNGVGEIPVLAYTDTNGSVWTLIGTPAIMDGPYQWDNVGNRTFCLGSDDTWFVHTLDGESEPGAYQSRLFIGSDSLSGWTLRSCDLTFTSWSGSNADETFFYDGDFYRVYDEITGTNKEVNFLVEEGVEDEGGGEPPLLEESPTGSDLSNIYIRNEVHTGRGYSAHHPGIRCWSPWGEGDYTTQRRKHILLGGVTTIDPTVGDVANIVAIYKMDDPAHYGIETFITDGEVTIPRIDPLRARWRSKGYPLYKGGMGMGLLRGFMFRYRRVSETFDVVVLVDGKTSFHHTCDPSDVSMDELMETFISATTEDNDGTTVQLEIDDQTLFPLIIEAIEPVRIEKGRRGY